MRFNTAEQNQATFAGIGATFSTGTLNSVHPHANAKNVRPQFALSRHLFGAPLQRACPIATSMPSSIMFFALIKSGYPVRDDAGALPISLANKKLKRLGIILTPRC